MKPFHLYVVLIDGTKAVYHVEAEDLEYVMEKMRELQQEPTIVRLLATEAEENNATL